MRRIELLDMKPKARLALLVGLGLLLGGGIRGVALAQSAGEDEVPYRSSIQVPDTGDEQEEDGGEDDRDSERGRVSESSDPNESESAAEQEEAARYQSLARITAEQARSAALAKVPGTVVGATLENEDGNLVYGVAVRTTAGERDVKVDAGNGSVLHVEGAEQDD